MPATPLKPTTDPMTAIRRAAKRRKPPLTAYALAKLTGTHERQVSGWLKGQNSPTARHVEAMFRALGLRIEGGDQQDESGQ